MLPFATRIPRVETRFLVVGLEPLLQAVVVVVCARAIALDAHPRPVGIALLLESLEDQAVDVVVELGVRRRLDGALRQTDAAGRALAHTDVVQLRPVLARQNDVGHLGAGVMEHVDVNPEIQLGQGLPCQRRVRHVHERAGFVDAALERIRIAVDACFPDARGIGPLVVVRQDRELLGAHHVAENLAPVGDVRRLQLDVGQVERRALRLARDGLHALEGPLDLLRHVDAGSGGGLLVDRRAGQAAIAGRAVEVASHVGQVQNGAHGLSAIAHLVGSEVQMDAAIAVGLALRTRRPREARLLHERGSRPVFVLASTP